MKVFFATEKLAGLFQNRSTTNSKREMSLPAHSTIRSRISGRPKSFWSSQTMTVSLSQGTSIVPRLFQDAKTLRTSSKAFAAMFAKYGQ